MRNTAILMIVFTAAVLLGAGCSTTNTAQDQRVATGAKLAVYVGSAAYLKEHPEKRAAFVTARQELRVLEAAETIDFVTLFAIVNRLPIKELKSPEAQIAITASTILLTDFAGSLPVDQLERLRPIVTAIRQGLDLALGP